MAGLVPALCSLGPSQGGAAQAQAAMPAGRSETPSWESGPSARPMGGSRGVWFPTAGGTRMWGSGPELPDSGRQWCVQLRCQAP